MKKHLLTVYLNQIKLVELLKSQELYISREKIEYDKLLEYVKKFQSQAVIKRLGYLLEILEIETDIIAKLYKIKTKSHVLLETELSNTGKMISK